MASNEIRPIGGKPLWKRPWVLAAGAGGVLALGMLVFRRSDKGPGSDVSPTLGDGTTIPQFSDAGVGAYQNLQNEFEALQHSLGGYVPTQDLQEVIGRLNDLEHQMGPGSPTTTLPRTVDALIPGKLDQQINIRWLATQLLPANKRNSQSAQETMVRLLVRLNPSWRGKQYVLGGHKYKKPA